MAVVLRQLVTNLMPSVSGGAYQDARKVSLVWNDIQNIDACLNSEAERTKRVQALFSPPSFLLREKRWGRRRRVRNDHDGTNPCKQGFLSSVLVSSFPNRKLNLRFGFFLCKSATTSQARSLCHYWYASSPGRGAFPPDRGNRPFTQGSLRAYSASPPSGPKRALSQVWQRPTQAWTAREAASTSRVATDMPWRPDSNRWHSHATP